MLEQIIIRYLAVHRRLVVPQLGAFLVKTPGRSVVFTELLRTDDGVLRGLLAETGLSALEAAGAVDRFVFEVRHAVQSGERYKLVGLGTLYPGPNGTIAFDYDAQAAMSDESNQPAAGPQVACDEVRETTAPAPKPEPPLTPSPKLNPAPYVKGLRYGKPERTTNAYTYVDRKPRRGFDKWLLIALVAAVIAVAAMIYGYLREADAEAAAATVPAGWPLPTQATQVEVPSAIPDLP